MKKLGVIVGSLRKDSYNKVVAKEIMENLKNDFTVNFINIGDLPLYNEDLDVNPPQEWERFRAEIKEMDAFIFVSPEYNRSMPAALKNALDVASRPMGDNQWSGKPGAVITASPGGAGGFGSNHHLRQAMVFLNIYVMAQPEAYLGGIADSIENGVIVSERTKSFIKTISIEFKKWSDNFIK